MQHDYPVTAYSSQEASAEAILHLTEQLAVKAEMILICTLEGNVLAANELAQVKLFGGNPNFRDKLLLDLIEEEYQSLAPKQLALLEKNKQLKGVVKVYLPDKTVALLSFRSALLKQDGYTFLHVSAKFATAEKDPEEGNLGSVVSYNSILQNTTVPLFIISPRGTIIDLNTLASDWIGYTKKELAGKSVAKTFELNPSERSAFLKTLGKVAEQGAMKFDWWIKTKDHSYLPVEITLNPGKYLGKYVVVGTGREISGRKVLLPDKASNLSFVNELVAQMNLLTEVEEILQYTLQQLIRNSDIVSGAIYEFDPVAQMAKLVAAEAVQDERLLQHQEIPLDESMVKQLTGPNARPARYKVSRSFQQLFGKKELIALPVSSSRQLTCILVLCVEDYRQITPSLTALVDFVGNETGNAIYRLNLARELSQSEKKYRTLFESSHDAVFLSTIEQILDCNSKAQELLGYPKEEIIGSKATCFSPEYQLDGQRSDEKAYLFLLKTLETGEPQTVEWQTLRRDHTVIETVITLDRVMLDGNFYVQTVVRDITQQKQIESALRSEEVLRESMAHFRNFLGKVNLPYMSQDLEGNITFINDYFLSYTGYKRSELIGQNYFDLLTPPEQREASREAFREMVQSQQISGKYEREILSKPGALKVVRWNSIFELDGSGQITGVTSVGKDLTDNRVALEALKDNKVRLQDLFDNAHDLIQNISFDNKFIFVNRAWKEKLGYDDADIEKLTLNDIVHPYYKGKLIYQLRNLYKGEKVNKIETVFMTKAGKPVHLIGSISCSFHNNKPVATRAILHDITDRIKAERLQKVYYSIANLAISSKDLPSLYSAIHRELSKIIETNNLYIALCNDQQTELSFVYYVDQFIGKNTSLQARAFSSGISEYVIQTGMPLFMVEKDVQQLIKSGKVKPIGNQPKVMLCSPLAVGERIIGMIAVQDYKKEDAYVSTDIEILHFISNQIALAIERKRNEEQINIQNARFKAIFESGSHLMWSLDRNQTITSGNQNYFKAFYELNGHHPHLNKTILQASNQPSLSPDQFVYWSERLNQAYAGQDQHFEIKLQDRKGEEVWLEIFLNPIFMEDGSFEEVSGIALDITDKKNSQLAMAVSEEKFRRIFESFQDVFYRYDMEGNMVLMSPSVKDLVGYTSEETRSMNGSDFYDNPEDREVLVQKILEQGQVRNFETSFRCKDGTVKQVLINARLIRDEEGQPTGLEGVASDISELKQTQNDLIKAIEIAQDLLEVKNQFLANMSHELRTPMNGIIGVIDLLHHISTTPEQKEYIDTLRRSSDALLDILNDILDLSNIQAGKMEISKEPMNLHYTLEKLHSLYLNRAQQKNLQFTYHIAPDIPQFINTDETRLLQVLSNLTSNAIKFTEAGKVEVNVSGEKIGRKYYRLHFEVKDSGIGIKEEDKERLFTNFTQLDNTATKKFAGTGLGLAISKQLSELLGGDIGVDSVFGEGSTFWFTIRCEAVKKDQLASDQLDQDRQGPSPVEKFQDAPYVLLVDDNFINQKVAVKLLEKIGCRSDVATNGFEAIERATSTDYDLIFMDIQMPEMDGVTATRHIKEKLGSSCPPIVAMTASTMKDDAEKFISQGLDDYVAKPVKTQDLYSMVKRWHKKPVGNRVEEVEEVEEATNVIDKGKMEQLLQLGGMDFAAQMYADFEEETEPLLEKSKIEVESKHYTSILSTLHQIKGTGSTLGLHSIAELAEKLEHDIKYGEFATVGRDFALLTDYFQLYKKVYKEILIKS
ncbi:hypothetical protein BH24BAC1_BH24BAC1_09720 [soil metagenome]